MRQSSAISVRIKALSQAKIRGQFNHDLRLGRQPNYVDQSRQKLNRVLINYPTPEFCKTDTEIRRRKTGTTRKAMSNQAVATSAIITFGVRAQQIFSEGDSKTQDEALLAVANTMADYYKLTVYGLVLHLDETAPHAHVVFSARDHQGKPFSKLNRGSKIQDLAADAIKQYFPEIQRGIRKRDRIAAGEAPSKIYHRSVKQLHQDLPDEIAQKQTQLNDLNQDIKIKIEHQNEVGGDLQEMITTNAQIRSYLPTPEDKTIEDIENKLAKAEDYRRRKAEQLQKNQVRLDRFTTKDNLNPRDQRAHARAKTRHTNLLQDTRAIISVITLLHETLRAEKDLNAAAVQVNATREVVEDLQVEIGKNFEVLEKLHNKEQQRSAYIAGLEIIDCGIATPDPNAPGKWLPARKYNPDVWQTPDPGPRGWGKFWQKLVGFANFLKNTLVDRLRQTISELESDKQELANRLAEYEPSEPSPEKSPWYEDSEWPPRPKPPGY